jgi:hypothetical protein
MFNSFLCTSLNIFQVSFPVRCKTIKEKNDWVMQRMKISCTHKEFCIPSLRTAMIQKQYYIKYGKSLRKVIKEAKKQHYSRLTADLQQNLTK